MMKFRTGEVFYMNTIKDLLQHIRNQKLNPNSLNDRMGGGKWVALSNWAFVDQVNTIAAGLIALGHKKGDKIALFAPPSSKWVICDLAIMSIGCISIPLYTTVSNDNFEYFMTTTETKTIVVGGHEHYEFVKKYKEKFNRIISLDSGVKDFETTPLTKVIEIGKEAIGENPAILDINLYAKDVSTIMFTSGFSEVPKGVVLSHLNLVCQLDTTANIVNKLGHKERYLNILPLAHIFGRLVNMTYLYFGGCIYYGDVTNFIRDCREVKPTFLVFVPRLIEKITTTIQKKIDDLSYLKKQLASWAFKLADTSEETFWYKCLRPIANIILYSNIKKLFGGELKMAVIGSSRSDPRILNLFKHFGISILEGYGLTEACPVTVNTLDRNHIGTVGTPAPGTQVKISPEGEILVKGSQVMLGYYNNPELTKAIIDEEGWFHTRDIGKLNENNDLIFINRFDDRAKTSYGMFIDIPKIEMLVNRLPFVTLSAVIANDKPYVTCLIFPNYEAINDLKKQMSLEDFPDEDFMKVDFMTRTVERAIKEVNDNLDEHDRIRAYRFIFDKNIGDVLTQTMKLRRKYVELKYKDLINEMYPEKIINI